MADYTALVEAGESLVELLRTSLTPEPIDNRELITLCSPHESEDNRLTVFMFHLEEDAQNTQAGYYQYSKDIERIRPAGFTLNFLITAHSKAPVQIREADQYRIIGAVVQTLRDNPVLAPQFLRGSLRDTDSELHVSVERPNFEQMMKIWNNTSSRYKLSVVCRMTGVTIDSSRERRITRVTDVTLDVKEKDQ